MEMENDCVAVSTQLYRIDKFSLFDIRIPWTMDMAAHEK
jgi:hypothetical protein